MAMTLENLKEKVRAVGARYDSRHDRAKRIFIEERAASLASDREREYDIKNIISNYFDIPYAHVCFAGSSQLGFSVKKEKLFQPGISDLDVACIDGGLYHQAWIDIIETTSAFTNFSGFGHLHLPCDLRGFEPRSADLASMARLFEVD
jgi:hypothetical protein